MFINTLLKIFNVLLTVHLGSILANNQLDTQFFFFVYIYSNSLHVSSTPVLIIRRINCINTTSDICKLHRFGWNIQTCTLDCHLHRVTIPAVVLIQLILLMMSTRVLETCRELE